MSDQIIELTDGDFDAHIKNGVALVDFWAPWCGPCRMQSPILDQVARMSQGRAKVAKVNIDESPAVAAAQGVQSIPTMIVFKDGVPVQRFVGVRPETDLLNAIDKAQN
jgi:thioredoxin 1